MADDNTVVRRPKPVTSSGKPHACLIVLSGELTGRIYRLANAKYVLGRSDEADIKLLDDGVSRLHAELRRYEDGLYVLKDRDSTNGTFVNGEPVRSRVLQDGDRIQMGSTAILKFSVQDSLEDEFQEKLYQYATRDSLTGAHNKRFFEEQLSKDFSYAHRHSVPLSVLLLDLDHFKEINDSYGHQAGDSVLNELGTRLKNCLRKEDVLCRIGGEEFAVILRDTNTKSALELARRLLALVAGEPFVVKGTEVVLTTSIGLATCVKSQHQRPEQLIAEADQRLYEAKSNGRNTVRPRLEP